MNEHPGFEPTHSEDEQNAVLQRFDYLVSDSDSSQATQFSEVREALGEAMGRPVDLEEPLIRGAWDANASQWDRFVHWAARFRALPTFDRDEREYKLLISERMRQSRDALSMGEDDWLPKLKKAFGPPNNVLHAITKSQFLNWCSDNQPLAIEALSELWDETRVVEERIDRFLAYLPREGTLRTSGNRKAIPSVLLSADDPHRWAFYLPTPFHFGFERVGYPSSDSHASSGEQYLHSLGFLDSIIEEASNRRIALRDRLDAQSVLWCVSRWTPGDWTPQELDELQRFRDGLPPNPYGGAASNCASDLHVPGTLADLAAELHIDADSLEDIQMLLEHKRQAIFFGPPGTGKTYIAMKLAEFLAGDSDNVDLVQFHAAYAYEDFVEGFRPRPINGQPGFRLEDGPLKRIAREAREDPHHTYVLIIDEINRANIARVFGELYFLLEYRTHEITLQYSAEPFTLPENLLIIGTMNTADRSIALIDAALRRRFYFIPFFPTEPPIAGILDRWLAQHNPNMRHVSGLVDHANAMLDYRHGGIGPSYFMRDDLDKEWLRLIWNHQIIPYLEEHFFGEPGRLDDFQLENLLNDFNSAHLERGSDDPPEVD